jgi:molybdate/tungstate transport system substrate-binding protein
MAEQRSRRAFLAGAGALGAGGVAGYVSVRGDGGDRVSLLVAGSLADAVENGLRASLDRPVTVEAHGSAHLARLVAEGQRDPDIVSVADRALFSGPLAPPWDAAFATSSLVVAYTTETPGGRRVAEAGSDGWYRALADENVSLGRTDPRLDPLGYRTLFLFELAADHYDDAGPLRERIPSDDQRYPETQLLSQFETGNVDAAVVYRSVAEARGLSYHTLPREIDLSDPEMADRYASVTYEMPDGRVLEGAPIVYGSTMRREDPAVRAVFERHVGGAYLGEYGFETPESFPRYTGNVPDSLA